jgi:hypothetical protein
MPGRWSQRFRPSGQLIRAEVPAISAIFQQGHPALQMDGSTSYAQTTDGGLRIEANNAFSWAFWTRLNAYDNNVLPRFWEQRSDYVCIMGDRTNGKFRQVALEIADVNAVAHEHWGRIKLNTGEWIHIAGTYDGATNTCRQWVNGVEDTVDQINPGGAYVSPLQVTTGAEFFIGRRRSDLIRNLAGAIGDIGIWNRVLTPAEVVGTYTGTFPASGLILRWPMAEGNSRSLTDLSGSGHTGVIAGERWLTASQAPQDSTIKRLGDKVRITSGGATAIAAPTVDDGGAAEFDVSLSGSGPWDIAVAWSAGALQALAKGIYSRSINVASVGASNTPLSIPVNITVL